MNWLEQIIHDHYGTKDYFAKKLGVSRWTVYRWIRTPEQMPLGHLITIQKYTRIDLNQIVRNNESIGVTSLAS